MTGKMRLEFFQNLIKERGLTQSDFCELARITYRTFPRRCRNGMLTLAELSRANTVLSLSDQELDTLIRG